MRGFKSGACWGFPKGKINQDETEAACGAREVYEETGCDVASSIVPTDCITVNRVVEGSSSQRTTLFIVPGVSEDTPFGTLTRKEIGAIMWHPLTNLLRDNDGRGNKYFFVKPFVQPLLRWIQANKKRLLQNVGVGGGGNVTTRVPQTLSSSSSSSMSAGRVGATRFCGSDASGASDVVDRFSSLVGFKFDTAAVMASLTS